MNIAALPDDINQLKAIIGNYHAQLEGNKESLLKKDTLLKSKDVQIKFLANELRLARALRFAHKSEKWKAEDSKQALLFNEIEVGIKDIEPTEEIEVKTYKRRKKKSKDKPLTLVVKEIIHDLEEHEKICGCSEMMTEISRDTRREVEYIPAQVFTLLHIYINYACKKCNGFHDVTVPAVKCAARKKSIIPKSFASPGLLAYLLVSKFVDHLPFYRMERVLKRIGLSLSRATMCNWSLFTGRKLRRLCAIMRTDMMNSRVLAADETPLQVLNEPGRSNTKKSYMWLFKGETQDKKPIIIYKYNSSRGSPVPLSFLKKYKGVLLTDGLSQYEVVVNKYNLAHAGCWAHVRRKFNDAIKGGESGICERAMLIIQKMYMIERKINENAFSDSKILDTRNKETKLLFDEFFCLMEEGRLKILPKSLTGKAIYYALSQNEKGKLSTFFDYAFVPIDNNMAENYIRPFAVGRRNWLFSGSPRGAAASVAIYSAIQTAIANGLDPYWYLRYLFEKLPYLKSKADFRSVAPYNLDADIIKVFAKENGGII